MEELRQRLPPVKTFMRDENIFKKGASGVYGIRRIVTTETNVYFCQTGRDDVLDEMLVHEIASVWKVKPVRDTTGETPRTQRDTQSKKVDEMDDKAAKLSRKAFAASSSQLTGNGSFNGSKARNATLNKIDAAFKKFDKDHNGFLDFDEFKSAFAIMGLDVSEAGNTLDESEAKTFRQLFDRYDTDKSETVCLEEWRNMAQTLLAKQEPETLPNVIVRSRSSSKGGGTTAGSGSESQCEFCIETTKDGQNHGRSYYLRAGSPAECDEWVGYLNKAVRIAIKRERDANLFLTLKHIVRDFYYHDTSQMFVAFMIATSFIVNIAEEQLNPARDNDGMSTTFASIDLIFTLLFLVELLVNIAANWFLDFWRDSWNIFDFIVVAVCMVSLFSPVDNSTAIRSVRLLRAFRVLRLFGRLGEIRKIIYAIGKSLFPVANAFVVVLLIMCVYAILGVQLFRDKNGHAFGNFAKALYTMFACTTMDGWQELVVMPMIPEEEMDDSENVPSDWSVVAFFISFFLIVVWTMLPVVVAILIDNFTAATRESDDEQHEKRMRSSGLDKMTHMLDPLMELICQYESEADLKQKIDVLYLTLIGDDDTDLLSAQSFGDNLRRREFRNGERIHVSLEDFEALTQNGKLCNADGCMSLANFVTVMRSELKAYSERQVAKQLFLSTHTGGQEMSQVLYFWASNLSLASMPRTQVVRPTASLP